MAADEERKDQVEETPAEEGSPADESVAEDQPKDEAPKDEAPADEPAEEASAGEDSGEDSDGDGESAAGASEGGGEAESSGSSDDELDWKAKARLERSREPHEAKPQRSADDRAAERATVRAQARKNRSAYRKKVRGKKTSDGTGTAPAESESVGRKVRQGMVVSSKADKTITVRIDVARRHPVYEKIVRRSQTLHAHDEKNEAGEGDLVKIVETRPISRTKRWRLSEIVEKAR